jgi:hypothetical protein
MGTPATVNYDGDMSGADLVASDDTASSTGTGRGPMMAAAAAGGIASAIGTFESARINRSLARFNANYQRLQAEQALQAGGFAAVRRQVVQEQLTGRTRDVAAGSGTVVGAGSNRMTTASQEAGSAMDAYLMQLNAGREAYARRVGAAGTEMQGNMGMTKGEMQALSTLLNTGSDEWLMSDPQWDPRYGRGIPIAR